MRTVKQFLEKMEGCPRAVKKYASFGRAFKKAFLSAHWRDAQWIVAHIFRGHPFAGRPFPSRERYPELPWLGNHWVLGNLFEFSLKKNREKNWPVIRRRLIELGVKL